jgi:hypothetical protein
MGGRLGREKAKLMVAAEIERLGSWAELSCEAEWAFAASSK